MIIECEIIEEADDKGEWSTYLDFKGANGVGVFRWKFEDLSPKDLEKRAAKLSYFARKNVAIEHKEERKKCL